MRTMPPLLRFVGLDEAARLLGCGRRTLARWIACGKFPASRTPGGRYQIALADIEAGLHLELARRREGHP